MRIRIFVVLFALSFCVFSLSFSQSQQPRQKSQTQPEHIKEYKDSSNHRNNISESGFMKIVDNINTANPHNCTDNSKNKNTNYNKSGISNWWLIIPTIVLAICAGISVLENFLNNPDGSAKTIIVIGVVKYKDSIGIIRVTGFCWEFNKSIGEFTKYKEEYRYNYED